MRDESLEKEFEILFKSVSLAYSARQQAKLKRRWPLREIIAVAPAETLSALKKQETLFLELTNVKSAEYISSVPDYVGGENWISASEGDLFVFVSGQRDKNLLGEGLMRDLARRVQALRKELGYVPTEVLDAVHIAELDEDSRELLEPFLEEMAELVRAQRVHLHDDRNEVKAEWHESKLEGKKIYILIH